MHQFRAASCSPDCRYQLGTRGTWYSMFKSLFIDSEKAEFLNLPTQLVTTRERVKSKLKFVSKPLFMTIHTLESTLIQPFLSSHSNFAVIGDFFIRFLMSEIRNNKLYDDLIE